VCPPSAVADQQGVAVPWTAEEQKLLEQALRTYPASTADRWDRIAECVPSRSKKDCQRRFKVNSPLSLIFLVIIIHYSGFRNWLK